MGRSSNWTMLVCICLLFSSGRLQEHFEIGMLGIISVVLADLLGRLKYMKCRFWFVFALILERLAISYCSFCCLVLGMFL